MGATPGLLVAVFAVMAALFVFTYRVDRQFDRERIQRGQAHSNLAKTAADYGSYPEAIEHYREALLHVPGEPTYRRGLAVALYQARRYQEAETHLRDLRTIDPTDAVANRLLARLAVRNGNGDEAIGFFRTAIYGRWQRNPEQNRLETRFELIEFLEQRPGRQAVHELLALIQEEPSSTRLTRRVAGQLLEHAADAEAERLLARLAAEGVDDGRLHADLARARFNIADFHGAHLSLERAFQKGVSDPELEALGDLLHDILALDPTQPGLRTRERLRRTRILLQRSTAYVESCAGVPGPDFVGPPPPLALTVSATLGNARKLLDEARPSDMAEAVEARLLTAANLWSLRDEVCTGVWDEDEPLRLLMRRLAP